MLQKEKYNSSNSENFKVYLQLIVHIFDNSTQINCKFTFTVYEYISYLYKNIHIYILYIYIYIYYIYTYIYIYIIYIKTPYEDMRVKQHQCHII